MMRGWFVFHLVSNANQYWKLDDTDRYKIYGVMTSSISINDPRRSCIGLHFRITFLQEGIELTFFYL